MNAPEHPGHSSRNTLRGLSDSLGPWSNIGDAYLRPDGLASLLYMWHHLVRPPCGESLVLPGQLLPGHPPQP